MNSTKCARCGRDTYKTYLSTQHIPFGHEKGYLCLVCAEEDFIESEIKLTR